MPVVSSPSHNNRLYQFGEFELSVRAGELRKNGEVVRLQQQPLRILVALLEYQGEVVSRAELIERVWPDDSIQDVDNSTRVAINKLRQALGDNSDEPQYIETLPKRGYRWLYPVTVSENPLPAIEVDSAPGPELTETISPVLPREEDNSKDHPYSLLFRSVVVGAVILLGMFMVSRLMRSEVPDPKVLPLTTYPGLETMPSISRDATKVAFAWTGPNPTAPWGVYYKRIGDERPIRVADTPIDAADGDPVWAPDGHSVYFFRRGQNAGIYLKSIDGGEERQIVKSSLNGRRLRRSRFDLSPDGNSIVYPDEVSEKNTAGLFLLDMKTMRKQQITDPPADSEGDGDPAFSHDGKNIAFQRDILEGQQTFVIATHGGPLHLLASNSSTEFVDGLAWTPDDREILIGGKVLRRLSVSGTKAAENVMFIPGPATFPALVNSTLAYVQSAVNANVWKVTLRDATHALGSPQKLISSTQQQAAPSYSPDGSRIAFQSDRSGAWEIWVCNRNGSDAVQLTRFGGPAAGTPHWSPDGKQIAFDALEDGKSQVFVVSADGGTPRRLTHDGSGGQVPNWSRDGKWLYYSTIQNGEANIMKMPVSGGAVQQVTQKGGLYAAESIDGKYLYFSRGLHDPTIWRMPTGGGTEEPVAGAPKPFESAHWGLVRNGLYAVNGNGDLQFYEFDTRSVSTVLHDGRLLTDWSMAVSPDGREIIWAQIDDRGSDLMLVQNFR